MSAPLESASTPAAEKAPKRRISVEGKPGIFFRKLKDGTKRYEIWFKGSDGVRHWQMMEPGETLTDAVKERRKQQAEIDKGGKVAPTRETFETVAERWLERQESRLRPRTIEWYRTAVRVHLLPRFGDRRLAEITEDRVAALITEMTRAGYAGWTIKGVLTPLSRILGHAARQGWIASNPVTRLEKDERPKVGRREMRVLEKNEIEELLASSNARYRPLIATAIFTGLRQGELLGLRWEDVDLDAGLIRVRKQLGRDGARVEPKTEQAKREVVLMPALSKLLREHKLASPSSRDSDPVFASERGTPLHYRNAVRRGFEPALEKAGLGHLRWHDLRHTFASILIAQGENVVWISRQLGHSSPSITLNVYAHEFGKHEHAERMASRLEASFGSVLATREQDEEHGAPSPLVPAAPTETAEVAQLRQIGTGRE